MAYENEGTLTTDEREISISETWDSQENWEAYQSIDGIEISNGILTLEEIEETNIPTNGLAHEWKYDEGSGSTASDSVQSLDGDINGASWDNANGGEGGFSLQFDGTDDNVSLGTGSGSTLSYLTQTNEWTIIMAVRPILLSGNQAILNNSTTSTGGRVLIRFESDSLVWYSPDDNDETATASIGSTDVWYDLVFRADSGTLSLFVDDDTVEDSTTWTATNDETSEPFSFGGSDSSSYFEGNIDWPIIWDRGLSDSEVNDVLNERSSRYE